MPAIIDISNGRANMAYVGAKPWHGLGQELTEDAPIEVWAKEAGLTHSVERSRVVFRHGAEKGAVGVLDDQHVLWRSDTKAPLGVVSSRYKVHQPAEILEVFADATRAGNLKMETAGSLKDGKIIWALARDQRELNFGAGDIVRPYVFLTTSYDGSTATHGFPTFVRVVCCNTHAAAMGSRAREEKNEGRELGFRLYHRSAFSVEDAKTALDLSEYIAEEKRQIEALIDKALTAQQTVELLVDAVATRDEKGAIKNEAQTKKLVGEIMAQVRTSPGANLETARGTAWGVFNGVTRFVDFHKNARTPENRFYSAQFGAGKNLKNKIRDALLAA